MARRRRQTRRNSGSILAIALVLAVILLGTVIFTFFLPRKADRTQTANSAPVQEQISSSQTTPSSESQTDDIIWEKATEPVQVPILMYHAIHVMAPEEEANANLIVDPTTFESHLKMLQDNGYYSLSPEEAYKVLTENVLPRGKNVVWLTFDDSLWDFYVNAFPLLSQYGMKATNNVITGFTESGMEGYLTVDQMKEMQAKAMSFQGHTVHHPDLEVSSLEDQSSELSLSKNYLDTQLQQDTSVIAYPAGRYSQDTLTLSEQAGYKLGLTTNNGLASLADGLLSLNRIRVLPTTTADSLLAEIAVQ